MTIALRPESHSFTRFTMKDLLVSKFAFLSSEGRLRLDALRG